MNKDLNPVYDGEGAERPRGVEIHTKEYLYEESEITRNISGPFEQCCV